MNNNKNESTPLVAAVQLTPPTFNCISRKGADCTVQTECGAIHEVISFTSNDILGLSQHPEVKRAAIDAIHEFGTSTEGSYLTSGRITLHDTLEANISSTKSQKYTRLFSNAWMAASSFFDAVCHFPLQDLFGDITNRGTLVLTDSRNHASLQAAAKGSHSLSGSLTRSAHVNVVPFRHSDASDLALCLESHDQPSDRLVLITDSVFSMSGRIPPLNEYCDIILSRNKPAVFLLDEAHSTGSIGKSGFGIFDHFAISPRSQRYAGRVNFVTLSTFSKFAASAGAALSTDSLELFRCLGVTTPYASTAALTPPNTASAAMAFDLLLKGNTKHSQLRANVELSNELLGKADLAQFNGSHILAIAMKGATEAAEVANWLMLKLGVWVTAAWYVEKPLLRIVITADHSASHICALANSIVEAKKRFPTHFRR